MGHIASADGLKVEVVVGMPTPANKTDLQRILGMT